MQTIKKWKIITYNNRKKTWQKVKKILRDVTPEPKCSVKAFTFFRQLCDKSP